MLIGSVFDSFNLSGVMGGVVSMDGFLDKFFPAIAEKAKKGTQVSFET